VWLDEGEMLVGDSLIEKLREGIDSMDYVGAVISSHSIASEWVRRELDVAVNQEIQGRRVKVLPLLLDNCALPGFLEGKLFADFRDPNRYEEALRQVLRRLGIVDTTPKGLLILRNPMHLEVVVDDHSHGTSEALRIELISGNHELYVEYKSLVSG